MFTLWLNIPPILWAYSKLAYEAYRGPRLQTLVRTVAKGAFVRVFAAAPSDRLFFREFGLLGSDSGSLMGPIAHGLIFRETASTPPVGAGGHFFNDW